MSKSLSFIYLNADKGLSANTVTGISEKGEYFHGFCSRVNNVRSFRHDRIVETVENENELPERLSYWQENKGSIPKKSHRLEIVFTGFKADDKARLEQTAKDAGMLVRSSMSGYLDFLCYGYNAGSKKMEYARTNKILILSEAEFMELLETGSVPT